MNVAIIGAGISGLSVAVKCKKNNITDNPIGANKAYNPNNPYIDEKIIRGGSFLCNASYCASYRVSSRMATDPNTSLEHLGFRTVKVIK